MISKKWKALPYWAKGGSLLPTILIISFIMNNIGKFEVLDDNGILESISTPIWLIGFLIHFLLSIPLVLINELLDLNRILIVPIGEFGFPNPTLLGEIILILFWFIIGALIGKIIYKIKLRK